MANSADPDQLASSEAHQLAKPTDLDLQMYAVCKGRSHLGPEGPGLTDSRFRTVIIGIKLGFSCINIRQVLWEVLKTEAEA